MAPVQNKRHINIFLLMHNTRYIHITYYTLYLISLFFFGINSRKQKMRIKQQTNHQVITKSIRCHLSYLRNRKTCQVTNFSNNLALSTAKILAQMVSEPLSRIFVEFPYSIRIHLVLIQDERIRIHFRCTRENIATYPEIYRRVQSAAHKLEISI